MEEKHKIETIAEILLGAEYSEALLRSIFGPSHITHWADEDPDDPRCLRHYYSIHSLGLHILTDNHYRINTGFFVIEGDEDVDPFPWSCASGIEATSCREDVQRILGMPAKSAEAIPDGLFGLPPQGAWDAYDNFDFGRLHFQYKLDAPGISKVTAMTKDAIPGGEYAAAADG
ncbi:MAG: hypothetical protein A2Z14_15610 [Chloroflexi bacterium RBG_16_48_8]|nr:MAG: hypothetical protein A2Z14_15610 [Chloroflexi bacterium RBG_16_48_8]